MILLWSAVFFQNQPFQKILSGKLSECQTVWIQIRTDIILFAKVSSRRKKLLLARVKIAIMHAEHHARENWPLTKTNLQRNDRAMIRQICSIKPEDVATVWSSKLLAKLVLGDLGLILRERLRWFGHVEHSSGAVRTACDILVEGRRGPGRPKLKWRKLTENDFLKWKLMTVALKKGAPGDQA